MATCWIGAFDEGKAKRILGLPRNSRIVPMAPLGYPAEGKGPVKSRKPLKELVHFEHWWHNKAKVRHQPHQNY